MKYERLDTFKLLAMLFVFAEALRYGAAISTTTERLENLARRAPYQMNYCP